jgi:hypothetical protein
MRFGLFAAACAALVLLAGCGGESLPTYRYKLTVEVETPEGLRAGSAVREVEARCSTAGGYVGGWRRRREGAG